jgi:hypothetical protein
MASYWDGTAVPVTPNHRSAALLGVGGGAPVDPVHPVSTPRTRFMRGIGSGAGARADTPLSDELDRVRMRAVVSNVSASRTFGSVATPIATAQGSHHASASNAASLLINQQRGGKPRRLELGDTTPVATNAAGLLLNQPAVDDDDLARASNSLLREVRTIFGSKKEKGEKKKKGE